MDDQTHETYAECPCGLKLDGSAAWTRTVLEEHMCRKTTSPLIYVFSFPGLLVLFTLLVGVGLVGMFVFGIIALEKGLLLP